ncbi:MAG: 1,2-phenylacetyl-CoA epoxidase subunit PaaD, partial [Terriglobales bacterium]
NAVPAARLSGGEMVTVVEAAQIWGWLEGVPDPELPAISVVDLGIVRAVEPCGEGWTVTVTPTYSGCPATAVIREGILAALRQHGLGQVEVRTQIAPPWTTDWLSPKGREALRQNGIAPPLVQLESPLTCPQCWSPDTERVSQFGSTPCKALYRCRACLEPFDYFKPHA